MSFSGDLRTSDLGLLSDMLMVLGDDLCATFEVLTMKQILDRNDSLEEER